MRVMVEERGKGREVSLGESLLFFSDSDDLEGVKNEEREEGRNGVYPIHLFHLPGPYSTVQTGTCPPTHVPTATVT